MVLKTLRHHGRRQRMAYTLDRLIQTIQDLSDPFRHRDASGHDRTASLRRKLNLYSNRLLELLEGVVCPFCKNRAVYCTCHPHREKTPCTTKPPSRES